MELREHKEMDTQKNCKHLIEKLKHIEICEWASYCQHRTTCNIDYYFVNKDFIEYESDNEENEADIAEEIKEYDTDLDDLTSCVARNTTGM